MGSSEFPLAPFHSACLTRQGECMEGHVHLLQATGVPRQCGAHTDLSIRQYPMVIRGPGLVEESRL